METTWLEREYHWEGSLSIKKGGAVTPENQKLLGGSGGKRGSRGGLGGN